MDEKNGAGTVLSELEALANPDKERVYRRFFKTGRGEYGEGDLFWGLTTPQQRSAARRHRNLPMREIQILLDHSYHEARQTGLFILVLRFEASDWEERDRIKEFYLRNRSRVNNWDLVDGSAPKILGPWILKTRDSGILQELALSDHLWSQRIAVISTLALIREGWFEPTFALADELIDHPHDLIHKALGWMLREIGNRDPRAERVFLQKCYRNMPRTMLRYAIEKFPEDERKSYLRGEI